MTTDVEHPYPRIEKGATVVRRDRWDQDALADAASNLPTLATAATYVEDRTPFAGDLIADVHAAFYKPKVDLNDDILPSHASHRAIISEAVQVDEFAQLKEHTTYDGLVAGMAAASFARHLGDLFDKIPDVVEKAAAAQAAHDEYLEALDRLGENPADPEDQQFLDELLDGMSATQDDLDAAIDGAGPSIGRAVRAAVREAADQADDMAGLVRGWGGDPGEFARLDPGARIRLADRMANPRMRRVAEMFGRLRFDLRAATQNDWTDGPAEICDVKLGQDLTQIVPSELALLAVEDARPEFYRRYAQRTLLCYRLRERVKTARGPIVYLMDSSLSMEGQPMDWACGLGLALLDCARIQKRAFHAISFHGTGVMEEFAFPKPAEFNLERMLDFASTAASGSTDFMGPVSRAAELCAADFDTTGLTGADIVFVTDGLCKVTDDWLATFTETRERAGFRVWGIAIDQDVPQVLVDICPLTATIHDLFTGGDMTAIFRQIGRTFS